MNLIILRFSVNDTAVGVENQRIIRVPVSWLKEISLVDTPGTNAVFRAHQRITEARLHHLYLSSPDLLSPQALTLFSTFYPVLTWSFG